jgi:hypothetical protein
VIQQKCKPWLFSFLISFPLPRTPHITKRTDDAGVRGPIFLILSWGRSDWGAPEARFFWPYSCWHSVLLTTNPNSYPMSCGNVYPDTVTDDRLEGIRKEKITAKDFSRRDCIRKFSYHEIFCPFMFRGDFRINIFVFPSCFPCFVHPVSSFCQFRRVMRRVFVMIGHLYLQWLWALYMRVSSIQ